MKSQKKQIASDLKNCYLALVEMRIPKTTGNSALDDLVDSIAELDACYAGWALSIASGAEVTPKDLVNLVPLIRKCESIKTDNDAEEKTLVSCREFLKIYNRINKRIEENQ